MGGLLTRYAGIGNTPDRTRNQDGSQLTVRGREAAILINEGKMADIFEAGRRYMSW
ncbi:MAG: SPFH domain-containing protein [Bacteroidia bacterium]